MDLTSLVPSDIGLNVAIAICAIALISGIARGFSGRSEEHTSELQSP